ncbi:hypothetical protein ACLBOM_36535 [Escherichia coli]
MTRPQRRLTDWAADPSAPYGGGDAPGRSGKTDPHAGERDDLFFFAPNEALQQEEPVRPPVSPEPDRPADSAISEERDPVISQPQHPTSSDNPEQKQQMRFRPGRKN